MPTPISTPEGLEARYRFDAMRGIWIASARPTAPADAPWTILGEVGYDSTSEEELARRTALIVVHPVLGLAARQRAAVARAAATKKGKNR